MDKMNHTPETPSNRSSDHIPQAPEGLAYDGTPVEKNSRSGVRLSRRGGDSPGRMENPGLPTTPDPDRVSFTNEALRVVLGDSARMTEGLTPGQWDLLGRRIQTLGGLMERARATEGYKGNQGDYDLAA